MSHIVALVFIGIVGLVLKASAGAPAVPGAPLNPGTAEIVWRATTNDLPDSLWVYKTVRQEFSPSVVSNLLSLGGFTKRDAAKSPIADDIRDPDALYYANKERTHYLGIYPSVGYIQYYDEKAHASMRESPKNVPGEEEAVRLALNYLRFLGLDSSLLARKPGSWEMRVYRMKNTRSYFDRKRGERVNGTLGLRGVYFVRWIDSLEFTGLGTAGGVLFEFGDEGKIYKLEVNWRNFQPHRLHALPSPEQFVERVRQGAVMVTDPVPTGTKKIIITKITPFYQGISPDEKQTLLYPFADMELDMDTGETNHLLKATCPIVIHE